MRLLYIDIDTLRPDHLGCYGYHRDTSPNIDALAADGVRLDGVYASDTPCLPSRSALIAGRFGIRNGVVGHGGAAAEPFREGASRGFWSKAAMTSWANRFRSVGMHTTSISSFAERHSAYHWLAGFNESLNVGRMGMETADLVSEVFLDWIGRRGAGDDWFCHVHVWDPHTPYRAPPAFGDPFADEPLPAWYTEEVRAAHWAPARPALGPGDGRLRNTPHPGAVPPPAHRGHRNGGRAGHVRRLRHRHPVRGRAHRPVAERAGRRRGAGRDRGDGVLRPRRDPGRAGHLLRPPLRRRAHQPCAPDPALAGRGRGLGWPRRRWAALPARCGGDGGRAGRGARR